MLAALVLFDALTSPSAFWPSADALCGDRDALAAVEPARLGDDNAARDELFAYCKFAIAPRFAARPDSERMTRLEHIYAVLGKTMPPTAPALPPLPDAADVARWPEQATARGDDADLGLAGQRMLAAVLGEMCLTAEAKRALPTTCALARSALSLKALRAAVMVDLARGALSAAQHVTRSNELGGAALFALALEHEDVRRLFETLAANTPATADLAKGSCAAVPERAACEFAATTLHLLATVTIRILADGSKLDRPADHYTNVVEEALRDEAKNPDLKITPSLRNATNQLVVALKHVDLVRSVKERASAVDVEKANLEAVRRALFVAALGAALVRGEGDRAGSAYAERANAAITQAGVWLDRVAAVDPHAFFEEVKPVFASAQGSGGPSPSDVRMMQAAATLASARDADDIKRAARDALVPIPAWVDKVVFDLNLAPPESKSAHGESNFSMNGDVTVGYNGDHFGFTAHADSAYYELSQTQNFALTERYAGELDMWGLVDVSRKVAIEPRVSLGSAYYGTLADDATTSVDRQTNQDSILGRGSLLLGVRLRPHPRVALGVWGGFGAQYEDYYRVLQTSLGDQGTTFDASISLKYEGRVRFQATILPEILTARMRVDLTHFSMRRDDQAVTFSLGKQTLAQQGVYEIEQTEFMGRVFLDADVLRFFGFVPAAHAGANVFVLADSGSTTSSVVPVFGIGVRREAL